MLTWSSGDTLPRPQGWPGGDEPAEPAPGGAGGRLWNPACPDPRLDRLFMRLRDAANASDAGAVEAEIWRIWGEATDRDAQALCRSLRAPTQAR